VRVDRPIALSMRTDSSLGVPSGQKCGESGFWVPRFGVCVRRTATRFMPKSGVGENPGNFASALADLCSQL
jgi:hypothetical protein